MRRFRFASYVLLIACALSACETASLRRAREDMLDDDLFMMRSILNQYVLDNAQRPQSLNDLVTAGYLKGVPRDPFTGRNDTWRLEFSDDPRSPGIKEIHSGSTEKDAKGVPYSSW